MRGERREERSCGSTLIINLESVNEIESRSTKVIGSLHRSKQVEAEKWERQMGSIIVPVSIILRIYLSDCHIFLFLSPELYYFFLI